MVVLGQTESPSIAVNHCWLLIFLFLSQYLLTTLIGLGSNREPLWVTPFVLQLIIGVQALKSNAANTIMKSHEMSML